MWKVNPSYLCNQHLLGEHVEMHMFAGCINKGVSLKGYLEKGLVEVHLIKERHEELVKEMLKRGFNHQSSLPGFKAWREGKVDVFNNLLELSNRCPKCKENIDKHENALKF